MPRRRELTITLKPLPLILSIALGLWLGAVAIAASLWLVDQLMPTPVEAPEPATAQDAPRGATPPTSTQPPNAQAEMFERYKDTLHKQQLEQAAEGNPRNLNTPKCQFGYSRTARPPQTKARPTCWSSVTDHEQDPPDSADHRGPRTRPGCGNPSSAERL